MPRARIILFQLAQKHSAMLANVSLSSLANLTNCPQTLSQLSNHSSTRVYTVSRGSNGKHTFALSS